MNNPKIVIPFWEVIKRSFNYVFLNFSSVSRLIAVPFLVMAGGQMLFKSQGMLLQLVLLLLTAFVGVSWSRLVILNEQPPFFKSACRVHFPLSAQLFGNSLASVVSGNIGVNGNVCVWRCGAAGTVCVVGRRKRQSGRFRPNIDLAACHGYCFQPDLRAFAFELSRSGS